MRYLSEPVAVQQKMKRPMRRTARSISGGCLSIVDVCWNLCQLLAQRPVQNLTSCCRQTVAHFMALISLRADRYCIQFRIRSCSLEGRRETTSTHRNVDYVAWRFLAKQLRNRWHATYFEGKGQTTSGTLKSDSIASDSNCTLLSCILASV